MQKWIESRSERLAAFFGRPLDTMWMTNNAVMPEVSAEMDRHLGCLNFEWHIPEASGACSKQVMRVIREKLLRSRPL
jgi:hypothetical protein